MTTIQAQIGIQKYKTILKGTSTTFLADEPEDLGGKNMGPNPNELLAASLGACTAITIKMYADRKEWPLTEVEVGVTVDFKSEPGITRFKKDVQLKGDLTDDQKIRLYAIGSRCPIHKALQQTIVVE